MSGARQVLDFIAEHKGDVASIEVLKNRFLETTPIRLFLPRNCPNISPQYNLTPSDHQITQEITLTLICRSFLSLQECFQHVIEEHFGCDISKPEGFKPTDQPPESVLLYYLFQRAICFDITGYDTCFYRASYASIKLYEALKNSELTVCVHTFVEYDQTIVTIRNKKTGLYVYDPLLNPELIFDFGFYIKNILPKFPPYPTPRAPYSITLSEKIISHCHAYWEKASAHVTDLLVNSKIPTVNELFKEPRFTIPLKRIIPADQFKHKRNIELTRDAITAFKEKRESVSKQTHAHKPG